MDRSDRGVNWRDLNETKYFASWSGGKDSCLALHRVMQRWGPPAALVNMLTEDGVHSRSHGLPVSLLNGQAEALGVPIIYRSTTWQDYETQFVDCLQELSRQGVAAGVFGDIDLQVHWDWEIGVCGQAGMVALEPLWQCAHEDLVAEFLGAGFEAMIVTVNLEAMPEEFLGRAFSAETVAALRGLGVDPSGEGGEFHTAVLDGPTFSKRVPCEIVGIRRHGNHATTELG